MQIRPKVSIIVPVYNASEYLSRCIESILNQGDPSFELIIVDDGSTDTSLAIARHYEQIDSRILVIHQTNSGASAARNAGLDCAEGDWILFVDADDWILPNSLACITESPDSDLIFFGFNEWNVGLQSVKCITKESFDASDDIDTNLTRLFTSSEAFFGFTFNKFYRKNLIDKYNLRFDTDLLIKEDEEFILRYCRYIKSLFISSATPYNYRILSESLSHTKLEFRRMTTLALKIDKDIINYPFQRFKAAMANATYRYYLRGVQESKTNSTTTFALNCLCDFTKRNRQLISSKNEHYLLSQIPINSIRVALLRFAILNPNSKFFSVSFYKHALYPIYMKLR